MANQYSSQNVLTEPSTSLPRAESGGIATIHVPSVNVSPQHPRYNLKEAFKEKRAISFSDDNFSVKEALVIAAAELLGTGIFVFVGCMSCVSSESQDGTPLKMHVAVTFGLGIMLAIQCFDHISGAHVNPIVTVAAVIIGRIPLVRAPVYLLSQLVGAIAGFAALKALTPDSMLNPAKPRGKFCSPEVHGSVTPLQAVFVEFLASLVLVLVVCGVWDARNAKYKDSLPLRVGFAVVGLALAAISYTGANMNPARSLGPALLNDEWDLHWVYWVGPLLAGVVGATVYRLVFDPETFAD